MNRGILIMVSIKDIAAVCGVSIATVSKALNDHKDVSETTKRTVQETAKKMGYFPNSQARALKTNRTYNIGVLFTEQTNSGLTQNYFASVLDSFKKEAESEGYDITFISGNIGERKMTPYEHCMYRNVDGVVVVSVDDYVDKSTLDELFASNVPIVSIDHVPQNHLSVVSDNETGMRQLVEYIAGKGHTKIAYIYGDPSDVTLIRVKAFKETLVRLNINIRSEFLLQGYQVCRASCKKGLVLQRQTDVHHSAGRFCSIGSIECIGGAGAVCSGGHLHSGIRWYCAVTGSEAEAHNYQAGHR